MLETELGEAWPWQGTARQSFTLSATGLNRDRVLRWPGALELTLSSNLDHWIVYSLPENAVCVEVISAPPNVFNLAPAIRSQIVEPEQPLVGEFNWAWQTV